MSNITRPRAFTLPSKAEPYRLESVVLELIREYGMEATALMLDQELRRLKKAMKSKK